MKPFLKSTCSLSLYFLAVGPAIQAQERTMIDVGVSQMIFLRTPDNSLTESISNPNKLTCFHLGFVHRQKSPFLTNHFSLSFTEKEYSVSQHSDPRFAPPSAYQTSPIYYHRSTTYSEKNANVSFSIDYMNNRDISPVIGIGVELGNAFTVKAHYTEDGTFFDRDSIGNMINKRHLTTVDQYRRSGYYLNTLSGMFNLGVMFRIGQTWNLGLIYSFRGTLYLGGPTHLTPYLGGNHQFFAGIYYYLSSKNKKQDAPAE